MARFTLTIACDGAAFGDESDETHHRSDRAREIARIMGDVAAWLDRRPLETDGPVYDTNGNRVGEWRIGDA